jgi:hypothetical protein
MNNVKVNPTAPLPPTKSSTSGYSNSGGNKGDNKSNYGGQTFQDIFQLILKNQ